MNKQIPDSAQLSAEKEQQRQIILKTIEEKGEMWMVAAMVHGSIGYHTPKHAQKLIARLKEGNIRDFCERCDACFSTDLLAMLEYDIGVFERCGEFDPEKAKNLLNFAEKVSQLDSERQGSISLSFPTMGV